MTPHLKRNFFLICGALLLFTTSYFIAEALIKFIIKIAKNNGMEVITLAPLETVNLLLVATTYIFIIFLIPLAMVSFYVWARGALYKHERKALLTIKYFVFMAILGGAVGYIITLYVILPFVIRLNLNLGIEPISGLENFVMLFVANILIMAILFQLPLVIRILNKLNLVKRAWLSSARKNIYVVLLVLVAIITPTTDAVSLIVIMFPVVLLYELSILLCTRNPISV